MFSILTVPGSAVHESCLPEGALPLGDTTKTPLNMNSCLPLSPCRLLFLPRDPPDRGSWSGASGGSGAALTVLLLFSCSVVSDSLRPHGLQHARPPCPSLSPRVCSDSCQCCHPTISPCAALFFFCLQSFPALGSFPMSQFFTSGGQSAGFSALASVLSVTIQS